MEFEIESEFEFELECEFEFDFVLEIEFEYKVGEGRVEGGRTDFSLTSNNPNLKGREKSNGCMRLGCSPAAKMPLNNVTIWLARKFKNMLLSVRTHPGFSSFAARLPCRHVTICS